MSTVDWATKRPRPDHSRWLVPLLVVLIALVFIGVGVAMARPSAAPASVPAPVVTATPSEHVPFPTPNADGDTLIYAQPSGLPPIVSMCDGKLHRIIYSADLSWHELIRDPTCIGTTARRR
jgi:hypothetical protein